ncbi:MAG: 5-(carboxyamino)imidazole ribonucleotide mutase [Prevotellaceae bacterium]|jgi:5-(carboxyamino)imidazole ribonucleotide mutase|nr:5-(carboxyamino)imidazole ribonucleotide mutase [Prevotellaceae bacterium]
MSAKVSIIMGSASDFPALEEAFKFLRENKIEFEVNALSAHRTADLVADLAKKAHTRGVKVFIAAAGGAAHLPGVVAAFTPLPVIGVPIKSSNSIDGWDSILSILQMPAGVPVATVALNGAKNAAILAAQIIGTGEPEVQQQIVKFKDDMAKKVAAVNENIKEKSFCYEK